MAAEQSPSSGLLLPRAARNVAPACAQARPDGCPDVLIPAAEALGRRQWDAFPFHLGAWDASDGARLGAAEGEDPTALPDAGAEKLAAPEPAVPEPAFPKPDALMLPGMQVFVPALELEPGFVLARFEPV